ncbi:MAG: 16S rRNA (cytosine(1402)-N(4))-methyltransferase RsmH [Parcubacteria group bacterium]
MNHVPVMTEEVMKTLSPKKGDFVIDGTLGGGGHAKEIVKQISPGGTLLGVDRDPAVIDRVEIKAPGVRVILVNANFTCLPEILRNKNLPSADGLLLDLGFSSTQLNEGRGFSFLKDEPLLMTYSDNDEPLHKVLRRLSRDDLKSIISVSGERYAKALADAIWQAERKNPVETTGGLVEIIRSVLPSRYEHGRIHPATRTFLAFRIFINQELESLEKVLNALPQILKLGGRVAIITFQSLEDRIVKNTFREMARAGRINLLTKKPISPMYAEIKTNPKARSAKLRAAVMN